MPTATPYAQVTGWLCVLLLLALLYRAAAGKTLKVYPFFYLYVTHILVTTALGLSVRWSHDGTYRVYYWVVESIITLLGMGITWEIHQRILAFYPGVRRLASMLLSVIFALVLVFSTAGRGDGPFSLVALERDLRTVQAIVLLILFALVAFYAIPLGKNVRGIAIGYVFGVATSVLNLSLRYYLGDAFIPVWKYGRPIEYLAGLAIWCVTLWSLQPEPAPPNEDIQRDYEWVSGQAVHALVRLRTHLIHPDRS
jgi:hypothetical protein